MAKDALRHLRILHRSLDRPPERAIAGGYCVPSAWTADRSGRGPVPVEPFSFYGQLIRSILDAPSRRPETADRAWVRQAAVYNLMVRLSTAFDHDRDGTLGVPAGPSGWRETGTFLKSIALLPWIRDLGFDTVHLLPVQDIGIDGRRGPLGSPYAVRDPFAIDPMLAEPLAGVPPETEFAAFIEAAHHIGLRVVLEIPLRTMSKDCAWAKDHPDWFYWIGDGLELHPPVFPPEDLQAASAKVSSGDHHALPEPSLEYREMFSEPPPSASVSMEGGQWKGTAPDGRAVKIAGAFPDWPPNDGQPVWSDITYLKFYQASRFNYVSYNTVRMYDSRILESDSRTVQLWVMLPDLVGHYAGLYGVDGIMVDMAHALPHELMKAIVRGAREVNPAFAFWAEDFSRTREQVETGFDAVLGGQWACQHQPDNFRDMLGWTGATPDLPPHLAAPETHNTPRAAARHGGTRYARYAWTVSCFIPGLPFLHSGFELHETSPVNTGLGFMAEELKSFPPESLPLFSARSLDWERVQAPPDWVRAPLALRTRLIGLIAPGSAGLRLLDAGDRRLLAFVRTAQDGSAAVVVVGNPDMGESLRFGLREGVTPAPEPVDLLSGHRYASPEGGIEGELAPGGVVVFASPGAGTTPGGTPGLAGA